MKDYEVEVPYFKKVCFGLSAGFKARKVHFGLSASSSEAKGVSSSLTDVTGPRGSPIQATAP